MSKTKKNKLYESNSEYFFIKLEDGSYEKDYRAFQFYLDYFTIENKCNGKNKDNGFIKYDKINGVIFNSTNKTKIYRISLFDILKTGCNLIG